jgi:hypothetical protein
MENAMGVTMADYEGFYPTEMSGLQSQEDLQKALDSGSYGNTSSGGPLIGQSLENTVRVVTFDINKHIPMFNKIAKQPAFATVEEFNRLLSYGEGGAFFNDGGLPNADDAQYERANEKVKFMGCMGEVTGPMMLAGRAKFGDILAQQVYNRTAFLLRKIEEAIFNANETCDPLAFRGLFQQIMEGASENVIDMRGKPLSLEVLEDGATMIADNYGFASSMFMGVREKASVSKLLFNSTRWMNPGKEAAAGIPVNKYAAANGEFDLVGDVWLRPGGDPLKAGQKNAPSAPATVTVTVEDEASQFDAATMYYAVSAVNSAGESIATAGNAAATVTGATQRGKLVIANPTGAKSLKIYRGATAGTVKFMKEVAVATGATTTFYDTNADLPGTSKSILMDETTIALKQLLPVRKIDLARISDSTRWMQVSYLTLVVYALKKNVVFKNIGK